MVQCTQRMKKGIDMRKAAKTNSEGNPGGFVSKIQSFFQTKEPSIEEKMNRRQFLRKGIKAAATVAVVAGASNLPTEAIASVIKNQTKTKDPKYNQTRNSMPIHGTTKGIELLAENQADMQKLTTAINHMDNLQKDFNSKLGIKYKETSRILQSYKDANAPIVAYSQLSKQHNGATAMLTTGSDGKTPFVLLDSNNALNGNQNNTAQNAYHEMLHMEQFVTKTHLLTDPGYSKQNIKDNMLEMEAITNAKEYELTALNSMVTIQQNRGLQPPKNEMELKFIAKKTKDVFINQAKSTNNPIAQYGIAATIAALGAVEKDGAKAVENGQTVKAAYEVLRGNGKHAKAFEASYEPQVKNRIKNYAAEVDSNVYTNPDKDISDITAKRWELDSRKSLKDLAPVKDTIAAVENPAPLTQQPAIQNIVNAATRA